LPLGDAMSLIQISPILVVFMGWLLLKEKLNIKHILTAFGGFVGVVLISKPEFLIKFLEGNLNSIEEKNEQRLLGVVICLLGGVFFALETIIFNKAKQINGIVMAHYQNIMLCILFPFYGFFEYKFQQWIIPDLVSVAFMVLLAFSTNIGYFALCRGF